MQGGWILISHHMFYDSYRTQELRQKSASKKERLLLDKQKQEASMQKQKQKDIETKLLSANARKEDMLSSKVGSLSADQQMKQERANRSWLSSLDESKELKQTSEKRLKDAAERKDKVSCLHNVAMHISQYSMTKLKCLNSTYVCRF